MRRIGRPAIDLVPIHNMADDMAAASGPLPDDAMRKRIIELVEGLPTA